MRLHSHRLKKRVFESRLKRAGLRFTDPKSRTDFRLAGAVDFDVDPAAFRERRVDGAQGELGRVAIATEMAEHDALDFSRQQFLDHTHRRRIRQVPVARLDPLFHRPRPM